MINNRQSGRRNRGRNNNGRPNGGNRGGGDNGNRIDNRARGNAAQLLEKYKNMARDAQMAGDRVNAEYYLQFADHYFRVLADNRARQEEQQQRYRRNDDDYSEDGDEFDSADYGSDDGRADQSERGSRDQGRGQARDQGRDQSRNQGRDQARDQDGRQDDEREARGNRRDRTRRDQQGGDVDASTRMERGVEGPTGTPAASISITAIFTFWKWNCNTVYTYARPTLFTRISRTGRWWTGKFSSRCPARAVWTSSKSRPASRVDSSLPYWWNVSVPGRRFIHSVAVWRYILS